jgi:aryl-alcohol dehydrogenase-like predicted oxidoreductase
MQQRQIGPFQVSAIGLGCMNLSHAYDTPPPPAVAEALLLEALERGVTLFDTAALYGFGANEELVGRVLGPHRARLTLASKGGLHGQDGKRVLDGRPETLKWSCEQSLRRLGTDVIDLYYLHRLDRRVPIEDSVGALADLVAEGKVRFIGLSEASAATIRRAHAIHPITAVQSEYSLWFREPEAHVIPVCRELGIGFVPFSPIGRGFLAGTVTDAAHLPEQDLRRRIPRFQGEHLEHNMALLTAFRGIAARRGCTPAQLSLAWLLAQGPDVLPIPGTKRIERLEENLAALDVELSQEEIDSIAEAVPAGAAAGTRYPAGGMKGVYL